MRKDPHRTPVAGHPGLTLRQWTDRSGRRQRRYDVSYRGPDRREHSATRRTIAEAEAWRRGELERLDRGAWTDPNLGRRLFADWSDEVMARHVTRIKPKTAASYESLLRSRILPTFGDWPLAAIRPRHVGDWISGMTAEGLSVSRIRQAFVVLSLIFDEAVRDELVARSPGSGARLPRAEQREAAFLAPATVEQIAASLPHPYGLMVRTMGQVGLRYGEAAGLRRKSIDVLGRRLHVTESMAEVSGRVIFGPTKTHAARRVPLTAGLARAFDSRLAEIPAARDALVFPAPKGGPLRHKNFHARVWTKALDELELPPIGIHALRHSAAAALISSGASAKAVQSILGHRSAAFTLTVYGHLFDEDLDEVANRLEAHVDGLVRDHGGITRLPRAGL
jgi:integrase